MLLELVPFTHQPVKSNQFAKTIIDVAIHMLPISVQSLGFLVCPGCGTKVLCELCTLKCKTKAMFCISIIGKFYSNTG